MNASQASQSLPHTRLYCREADGQLVLGISPSRHRVLKHFGGLLILFIFLTGFCLVALYVFEFSVPVLVAIGVVEAIFFLAAAAAMAAPYWTTTYVLVTKDRAVVKTVLYGRERLREYAMPANSRARQWYYPPAPSGRHTRDRSGPQGIEIGTAPDGPVEGSDLAVVADLSDESKPRFGDGLSRGELDWVAWRINQFLDPSAAAGRGDATPRVSPIRVEGLADAPAARPEGMKVRIVEFPFETRFIFPNSVQTRSYSGIGSVLLGLAVLAYPLYVIFAWLGRQPAARPPTVGTIFISAVLLLVGVVELLKGLTRLLGHRQLIVNPETITYRTTLLGFGLPRKLPTAQVISVGLPRDAGATPSSKPTRAVAPTIGCVIRTSERELNYYEAIAPLAPEERAWIVCELARCIDRAVAARVSHK